MARFRDLLRRPRLRSRFRSGFLLSREQVGSGLIRFRNPGLQLLRNGVLHQAKVLLLVLLKEARHDPVQVLVQDLLVSVRRFHRGRVVRGRLVIPILQDLDNLGLLEYLRLSGLINLVLLGRLHRAGQRSPLAGRYLNPGARRDLLRKESQEALLKAGTSQALHPLDHLSSEVQKARVPRTKKLLSLALLVGKWIGTPRSIRY